MSQIKNDRLLKAIRKEPVDATPIWIMRQAGRYLPEYRATRARAGNFMCLCKTPELACEVTLQPINRYNLDAAIIFSDILTIPDAMGLGLEIIESKGPVFANTIRSEHDIARLEVPAPEQLEYVYQAIRLVKKELADRIPLIGFCGSPWTLATYMIEGESVPGFPTAMKMLHDDPFLLHKLLDILANSVTAHLQAQIQSGAQVVMLFDTWGGILGSENYEEFSLYYIKQVVSALDNYTNSKTPLILFTKGGSPWLEQMTTTGCHVVGLDWNISLQEARERIGNRVALQGNMNPEVMLQQPDMIEKKVAEILNSFGPGSGHVFNLGHGITPDVPPENVEVLVDAVHELSRPYHAAEVKK